MNTASLNKQVWRIIKDPSSYWAQTLKEIYFPNTDFWNAGMGRGTSWVWKSLMHGRALHKNEGRWETGTGQNNNITRDIWLASGSKASLLPRATATTVSDLLNSNHEWDINALRHNLSPQNVIETIKTHVLWTTAHNHLIWPYSKDGNYTVKSGYLAQAT